MTTDMELVMDLMRIQDGRAATIEQHGEAALTGSVQGHQSEAEGIPFPTSASQPLTHLRAYPPTGCYECGQMPARVILEARHRDGSRIRLCGVCWHQSQLYRAAEEEE